MAAFAVKPVVAKSDAPFIRPVTVIVLAVKAPADERLAEFSSGGYTAAEPVTLPVTDNDADLVRAVT